MTTKEALLKSIEKWDKICFELGEDKLNDNCSLCQKHRAYGRGPCNNCPIQLVADSYCHGTPYRDWRLSLSFGQKIILTKQQFDAAIQEYFFLCMLYWEYYA